MNNPVVLDSHSFFLIVAPFASALRLGTFCHVILVVLGPIGISEMKQAHRGDFPNVEIKLHGALHH